MARMTNFRSAAVATGNVINDSAYDNVEKVLDNVDGINTAANSLNVITNVSDNIKEVEFCNKNMDDIHAVVESGFTSLLGSVITLAPTGITQNTTIPSGSVGISFGPLDIAAGAVVTVEGQWKIF